MHTSSSMKIFTKNNSDFGCGIVQIAVFFEFDSADR